MAVSGKVGGCENRGASSPSIVGDLGACFARKFWNLEAQKCYFQCSSIYLRHKLWFLNSSIIVPITLIQIDFVALIFMKSSQRNADLRTLAYPTLKSTAWKWKKCTTTKQVLNLTPRHCRNLQSQSQCQSFSWVRNNWNDTVTFQKRVYILLCYHMCKYSTAEKQ